MDLIPVAFAAGVYLPPHIGPQGEPVRRDQLEQIWDEVGRTFGYRQFHLAPDDASAQFLGQSAQDAVVINPPVVQVRDLMPQGADRSARKAEEILKVVVERLGAGGNQCSQLGVRHVYHMPAPGKDARAFALANLLGKSDEQMEGLRGAGEIVPGLRDYVMYDELQRQFTANIEPLLVDNAYLIIDLDAQFFGPVDLDRIKERSADAERYISGDIRRYLTELAG